MSAYDIINFNIKKQDGIAWGFNLRKNPTFCVSIGKVTFGSLPFRVGIQENDILLAVNDKDVTEYNTKEVYDVITTAENNLKLRVKRKKSIQSENQSCFTNNQNYTPISSIKTSPKASSTLKQNHFILSDQKTNKEIKENGDTSKSFNRHKIFNFDLNDAVSTLTIPGTNVTLDENKTKEFLMMSFEEEVKKQNKNIV